MRVEPLGTERELVHVELAEHDGPGALGSDTGGSIRIPASLCGLSGLKPTYGRVSRAGVLPLAWSMDHVGPMCRSAADCALMLAPMAGYDPRDPTTSVLPVPDYAAALTGQLKGLRVGILRSFFLEGAAPAQQAAVLAAVKALAGQGASMEDVDLKTVNLAPAASHAILAPEAYAYHEEWLKTRASEYGADVRERLRVGAFVTGAEYLKGQRLRTLLKNEVDAALAKLDVLLAPTTPIEATAVGQNEVRIGDQSLPVRGSLIRFTRPFNLTGHPAASVPCGFTAEGLPMGLQIIGRPFDEATVLRVADAYQRWKRCDTFATIVLQLIGTDGRVIVTGRETEQYQFLNCMAEQTREQQKSKPGLVVPDPIVNLRPR